MARTVLPRQWSVPNQLADFARRITSLEKFVLGLAPRSVVRSTGEVLTPITDSNFQAYTPGVSAPALLRVGDTVWYGGALRCTTENYLASGSHDFASIPLGFRPGIPYGVSVTRVQGSGSTSWCLQVDSKANAARYNGTTHSANYWMPFLVSWHTDDAWPS